MEHHYSTSGNRNTHYSTISMSSFRSLPPPPLFLQEWPPRSYSCSFCRREFRSAQALGGHMNVHRRDRAKLKESPPAQPTMTKPNINTEIMFATPPLPWRKEGERRWGEEGGYLVGRGSDVIVCNRHKLMEEIDLELRLGSSTVKVAHIS